MPRKSLKHTPGPWTVEGGGVARLHDHKGGYRLMVDITTDSAIAGEADANAFLIAAAPAMLATLQGIRGGYSNLIEFRIIPDQYREQAKAQLALIDRAIAEALRVEKSQPEQAGKPGEAKEV
jgi:hypothetical protein